MRVVAGMLMVQVVFAGCDTRPGPAPRPPVPAAGSARTKPFTPDCSSAHAPMPGRDASPMCLVPRGELAMGDDPKRRVRISRDFYIDQYEVTNAQLAAFVDANPDAKCKSGFGDDCTTGWR